MRFTSSEIVDMIIVFGECRRKARRAARLYAQYYPNRVHPSYKTILRLVLNAREGNFSYKRIHPRRYQDIILDVVRRDPHISVRQIARETRIPRGTLHRTLQRSKYHPYHISLHQALSNRDLQLREVYCRWGIDTLRQDRTFMRNVLFSDEATFVSDGSLNRHNSHYWSMNNPHWIRQVDHQHRWSVNVWCGILGSKIIGPYFFEGAVSGNVYKTFILDRLPELMEDLPLDTRHQMWFQHDGCPAHYSREARNAITTIFGDRWIGRGGPVSWPARSPDLTPLDYFLWGTLKNVVYCNPPISQDQMRGRIVQACRAIPEDQVLKAVDSIRTRLQRCLDVEGGIFEDTIHF